MQTKEPDMLELQLMKKKLLLLFNLDLRGRFWWHKRS